MKRRFFTLMKSIPILFSLVVAAPLLAAQAPGAPATNATVINPTAVRTVPAGVTSAAAATTNAPAARSAFPTLPVPGSRPAGATAVTVPSAAATAAANKTEAGEEMGPNIQFENMSLQQVLDFYSEQVGRTVLRANNLPTTTLITLKTRGPLSKSEAIMALETVMAMNNIVIIPVGEKFIKVVTSPEAPSQGGPFSTNDSGELPIAGRFLTQIVQLKYIPVQDAVNAIQPFASGKTGAAIVPLPSSQTVILRDFSENVKRMLEILERVDTVTPLEVKPEVIPIKYALARDIQTVLSSLSSGGGSLSVGGTGRTGLSGGGTSGFGQNANSGQYNPNQPNQQQTGMSSAAPGGRSSSFQNRLQSAVNRAAGGSGEFKILGEATIIADERTNSLLIFANDQDMQMIKDIIKQLDVVLAQVLIEALIMEVSLDNQRDIGISYLQKPKKLGGDVTGAGGVNSGQAFLNPRNFLTAGSNSVPVNVQDLPSGFSYFTSISDAFDVAVKAAETDNRFNVLSRPRIQTSHAVEAQLFIGETVPYITGTYYGGTVNQPSSQYQQKEVGIRLDVLPLINPDGLVVMDISQNVEQIGKEYDVQGAGKVPGTTKREALAKVAVRDRETIILGGFIETTKRKGRSGVPYLKDIPYLGFLFRANTDSSARTELMVFIRPTVLKTPEIAAIHATEEKDRLPGVKLGEFDIREDERMRNEAAEREMRKRLDLPDPKKAKKHR
jgi:general secretion pathway protein D